MEMSLIKNTFADNDGLLIPIRKSLIQAPMTKEEIALVKTTFMKGGTTLALLKKALVPEIDGNAPLFQMVDLWATIDTKEKVPSDIYGQIVARDILIKYLKAQFAVFYDGDTKAKNIDFSKMTAIEGRDETMAYAYLLARNTILTHIDFQLNMLKMLAGQKEESVDETKDRLKKDSAK